MAESTQEFKSSLGLLDATMIVAGSMIGSGIFIVSADITRNVGSAGWLIAVWLLTGFMTLTAALSYGELSAMFPWTQQFFLLFQRREVSQTVGAVGDGYRQVGSHDTGIVGVPGDPAVLHGHRHGQCQSAAVGHLSEQRMTGMADQVLPVGYHPRATDRSTTVHR